MYKYPLRQRLSIYLPKNLFHIYLYNKYHEPVFSLNNPSTYDEKIHYLIANVYDESYGIYADKYEVRNYVKKCGYESILVPLFGIWEKAEDIDFDKLPENCILKATHGSGPQFYEIIHKNDNPDYEGIRSKFKDALGINFAISACQYHYSKIQPRIICEKLLIQDDQKMLDDYKVVCSKGKAKAILVCTGRNEGRDYYSTDWKYLDYVKDEYKSGKIISRPQKLEEMLKIAEGLSKPFPLARIDFYIIDEKLYFGEITLTPSAGNHTNLSSLGQREIGKMITL
jgi:hypothetical protein